MRASRRAWRASYRTVAVTRSGFRGQVTMRGTGPPVTTAVSITLPVGATVTSASGAAVVQRGSTAIFTVRAATADFTFTVRAPGAAGPLACHLHHGSCTGVSG
ncbi:MAG TPA: hypothetical protein VES42_20590 [Pilimelia sp.]|nr:hypothetical protein [Pilimelia sp.]